MSPTATLFLTKAISFSLLTLPCYVGYLETARKIGGMVCATEVGSQEEVMISWQHWPMLDDIQQCRIKKLGTAAWLSIY